MTHKDHTPAILIILDGWGHREDVKDNAIAQAKTPFFDHLLKTYPHAFLDASSESVGLPEGQMGNSEVGHMTIGAGKIIDTDLVRIAKSIRNNEFATNPAFVTLFDHVKKYDSVLHIKGLLSPGGVHSHSQHLYAFLEAAKEAGIKKIAIHAFTDGRDVSPRSAAGFLRELEDVIDNLGIGFIATAAGRFYAMDRDNNWDRLEKVEKAIFQGESVNAHKTRKPSEVIEALYAQGFVDEHIEPVVFLDEEGNSSTINDNDGIFFFNFRSDRARMISSKIVAHADDKNLCFVTLTEYDKNIPSLVAFPPSVITTTLAQEVSAAGLSQAHVAETEKYAHATYFLNGGQELPHRNEEHILIESRKDIQTHDQAPKMRAKEIADKVLECIEKGTDFIFINFANADMVGHTGNREALIIAIEEIDTQLKRVIEATLAKDGVAFITADHGNAELNIDQETQETHTAHTSNVVPAIVTAPGILANGSLADVTPTMLHLMRIAQPNAMTGKNLFQE
ncbi:MAG: 2,3-bisphosphoglycerate-independent phosphoglycerate mutase [Candidatus Moranbacteria bacterium]|nr:2,3-bisphosphoglycerate-independent phosphoglycerate mutase [Candidatus Moranbacteria bacterium]